MVPIRLPYGVADLFQQWLERHLPDRKEKVLAQIRAIRDGKLNDSDFGSRMQGKGILAGQIAKMFAVACRRAGIPEHGPQLSTAAFRRPLGTQMELL
jgi:DNA repair photolyase